jgi:putative N6-adenine-specific DNA methylase
MEFHLFLIVSPGLEDLALEELRTKCFSGEWEQIKGGIEVHNVDLDWVIRAHCLLKIPTRILQRLTHFKVRDFPKLYSKFVKLNWNSFLSHPNPNFEITCTKSRLFHSEKIKNTIQDALNEALKRQALREDWIKFNYTPQTLYIRVAEDELTLSIDLSGEPLYKRGIQPLKGEAPLRENLASALLLDLLAEENTPVSLVDPMCGSGTFLTEALNFHVPTHLRKFHFEEFPFFRGKSLKLPGSSGPLCLHETLGFDINNDLISKIKKTSPLKLIHQDSLKFPLFAPGNEPKNVIMISNPPYGDRLKIDGKKGAFLKEALLKFLTIDSPKKMGWLIPRDFQDTIKLPENYQVLRKRDFRNGGLAVTFWIFKKIN